MKKILCLTLALIACREAHASMFHWATLLLDRQDEQIRERKQTKKDSAIQQSGINVEHVATQGAPIYIVNNQSSSQNTIKASIGNSLFSHIFDADELRQFWGDARTKTTEYLSSLKTAITEYVKNNKLKVLGSSLVLVYAGIESKLWLTRYRLNHSLVTWSLWQKERSLEELQQQPRETLCKNLLVDIQRTYTTTLALTDFIKPLIRFVQDAEKEEMYLKSYNNYVRRIDKLYLLPIFWHDKTLYETIGPRLARLEFIRQTFLVWLAEYKVNQSLK